MSNIFMYTDGSCNPSNPGPGGIAYIIRYVKSKDETDAVETTYSEGFNLSTNNRMEVLAAIRGMSAVITSIENSTYQDVTEFQILADSQYLTDAINLKWLDAWRQRNWMTTSNSPVKNKDLWEQIIHILEKLRSLNVTCTFVHVPGHQGVEFNERCDSMAAAAAKNNNRSEDTVYEAQYKRGGKQ